MAPPDFDLIVVGSETEACLSAVAGAKAGASVALLHGRSQVFGGLLTDGGLAFVDRDSRHEFVPDGATQDGLFGRFLQQAGVRLVALDPQKGHDTLVAMMAEAGVTLIADTAVTIEKGPQGIAAIGTATGKSLSARHWLDATADGDFAELAGVRFAKGFREYMIDRCLGVSPLPLIDDVDAASIHEASARLAADVDLQERRRKIFGDRKFLDLDMGEDYVLIGPPYFGLAYQRWRERHDLHFPYPFQADGFNVAMVGPERSSWNGLIYFITEPLALLNLSRKGADRMFEIEAELFVRFMWEELGWTNARLARRPGMYVRQSRHALETRHRLRLAEIVAGYDVSSVGTFAYFADFRGFAATPIPRALTAHVILDAGRFDGFPNLGLASRSGGYTPFAHSICRLLQYNVTLGAALAVASTLGDALPEVPAAAVRKRLAELDMLVDDPAGLEENAIGAPILQADDLFAKETTMDLMATVGRPSPGASADTPSG